MSELKTYKMVDEKYCMDCVCVIPSEVYLKSDADKVIAEKDAEITELKEQVHEYALGSYVMQARAEKEARHDKYKRCMAVARWCHNESLWWYSKGYGFEKYDKFWEKWERRWLELAEKFKLDSTAQQGKGK